MNIDIYTRQVMLLTLTKQTRYTLQAASLSWLVGGEDSSAESLVSGAGGRLCGATLPSLPPALRGARGVVAGAVGGRVYVCGGVAGSGELENKKLYYDV